MPSPQRIMIIGPSGAGKSTLARVVGQRLSISVVHLDSLFWKPGWVESTEAELRQRVSAAAAEPAWIIEGNYYRTLDLRLPRAEAVIWLDLPRSVYFRRAVWRSIVNYGRSRPDVGSGNREKFDPNFIFGWVWTYPTRARARDQELIDRLRLDKHVVVLRTPSEVRHFVEGLPATLSP